MPSFFTEHRKSTVAAIVAGGFVLVVVCVLAFMDWNRLRPLLAREITARTGRPASIDGDLKVHLWSWNPSAEVNGIRLQNPTCADRDLMFAAKRITISVSPGRLLRGQVVLPQVTVLEPTINLEPEAKGRATWEPGSN